MTRAEIIDVLEIIKKEYEEMPVFAPRLPALEMAIEAVKQQDKRCKICKYFHNINSRIFDYYCPNCGAHMEVMES